MQVDNSISGFILDEANNPLPGAVVRIKTTQVEAITDSEGHFTLTGLVSNEPVLLTAWSPGYFNGGGTEVQAGAVAVEIVLTKHAETDNPDYQFLSAFSSEGKDGNCENCHADSADPGAALPFPEWQADAHSQSTKNSRFLSMYLGQDIHGNQSPQREYGFNRDYGRIPLRPNLSEPYFGPGYKLDFPETAGNCAACHAPAAAINTAYETDPSLVAGVGAEGVACDFCHKVWDVRLNPTSGLPQANMPGVLSFEFRRPPEGHQFFAGPFDDVAPFEDTYTPIQAQSQYCAPCHFGAFWDTQVYNSFGEWLVSPYSDAETGKTCQDCHMPPGQNDHFARIEKGGEIRDAGTIFSHRMPGASDESLLGNAVTLTADARREGERIIVDVTILNDQTGHHVPTDSPLRQLILLVQAAGPDGSVLGQVDGPTIPEYGGVGDASNGYYAGQPGKIYSKVLMEMWTEVSPTGAYWNPTRVVADNRLAAFESDESSYVFAAPSAGPVTIDIQLLFRRAFKELAEQKGWDVPDLLMEQIHFSVEK